MDHNTVKNLAEHAPNLKHKINLRKLEVHLFSFDLILRLPKEESSETI